ncbi:hypothetical protein B0H17DRAFT_1206406 [Mycena rosella]|uniref:Uncharacterized protein n=1 Tax=Mycena rosella TaxID=1033263 RepID=A0AAD7D557_MYCRO|nr:hypothetical protein B0H17DRAFT_1206406 [Mycena rosella]
MLPGFGPVTSKIQPILARSRNLPLHVELFTSFETNYDRASPSLPLSPVREHAFGEVWDHRHRLKHLHLNTTGLDVPTRIFHPNNLLSIFTSLQIFIPETDAPADLSFAWLLLANTPSLRDLYFRRGRIPPRSSGCRFSVVAAHCVVVGYWMDLIESRDIVMKCTSLEACTLSKLNDDCEMQPLQSTHVLRRLHKSTKRLNGPDIAIKVFLAEFSCPNLLHLNIEGGNWSPARPPAINFIPDEHDGYPRFSLHFPSTTTLDISHCKIKNGILRAFTYNPDAMLLTLPALTSVRFSENAESLHGPVLTDSGEFLTLHMVEHKFPVDIECRLAAAASTGIFVDQAA